MYQIGSWTEQIADISEDYQNLVVELTDPEKVDKDYDIATGGYTVIDDGSLGQFPARLVTVRRAVNRENSETTNPDTITSITVQFPRKQNFGTDDSPVYRLSRGVTLTVVQTGDNPALASRVFRLVSDVQGGHAASRTIEFAVSGDAGADDGD